MRLILLLLLTTIGFIACKSKNETTITSEAGSITTVLNTGKMESAAKEMQAIMEELKKLDPHSTDQVKSFFPPDLMGIKSSPVNVNSMMCFSMGEAVHREND